MIYQFLKEEADVTRLYQQIKINFENMVDMGKSGDTIWVELPDELDQSQLDALQFIVSQHTTQLTTEESLSIVTRRAIAFGIRLIAEIAAENIFLGITKAGMTNVIRKNSGDIVLALITGSLYDAIYECRVLPEEKKDSVFITDERLLATINKIETYLGITLSEEL